MSFKFTVLCSLLNNLEGAFIRTPPLLPKARDELVAGEIRAWFRAHRKLVDGLDVVGASALLSALLPERRVDRVYGIQHGTLCKTLCRGLCLSSSKVQDLRAYLQPGHGDLASCLQRVLKDGGPPAHPEVTLIDIDHALQTLASGQRFSSPAVRETYRPSSDPTALVINIIKRLHASEAKWFVRLILKDLSPLRLNEQIILRSVHFLLPDILQFQQDFDSAIATLKGPLKQYPSSPDAQSANLHRKLVSGSYRPNVGIKVSRSPFTKAWSIDHCLQMTKQRRWMIERKFDGEYCEIHIDLSKEDKWLKIFSKSGKDSTQDRAGLKDVIRKSLGIGSKTPKIKSNCILLGEMVVWSDLEKRIMPFHTIRKYIPRSGTYIGTAKDSPRHDHEHLMIVYFDLLLLDDDNVMQKPLEIRKSTLHSLVRSRIGRAAIAESKVLDFADEDSKRRLMSQMAASVAARHEGLVLKPCGRPYLAIPGIGSQDCSSVIKLKKDYINGLGDELDLAVIGGSHDAQVALCRSLGKTQYTHFHVACLQNCEEVDRYQARPCFKVVGTISAEGCIPPAILPKANNMARYTIEDYQPGVSPSSFDLEADAPPMDVVFRKPFVFEVLGSSYEKPSNCDFWRLRHPRVKKLHEDRTWRDCVTFDGLQRLAKAAIEAPPDSESQENLMWMDKIERSCRRKEARASASVSPIKRRLSPGPFEAHKRQALTETSPNASRKSSISTAKPVKSLRSIQNPIRTLLPFKTRKASADPTTAQYYNVLDKNVTAVEGRCLFIERATEGQVTACPLSGKPVLILMDDDWGLAITHAKFHGARLCFSKEQFLAELRERELGIVHVREEDTSRVLELAAWLVRAFEGKAGMEVDFLSVRDWGAWCADCLPTADGSGWDDVLRYGWGLMRLTSVRSGLEGRETVVKYQWGG